MYGPGQNLENMKQGMVSIYLAQMLENQKIQVKGASSRYRDFIHVDDIVDACLACLSHPASIAKSINIGTGVSTSVEELLQKLIKSYHLPVSIEYIQNTPGDMHGIYADINLAKELLEFTPKYTLEAGLKTMLDWASSQQITQ